MTEGLPPGSLMFAANLAGTVALCGALILLTDWRAGKRASSETDASARARKSLWPRFRVWSIAAIVLWSALVAGPMALAVLLGMLGWVATREVLSLTKAELPAMPALVVTPLAGAAVADAAGAVAAAGLCAAALPVMAWRSDMTPDALRRVGMQLLALVWIGGPLACIVLLRQSEMGLGLVGWLLLVVALSDVMAMFGGLAGGKHHIAPRLSSGKTAEGLLAGMLGACLAAVLVRPVLPDPSWMALLTASVLVSGISVLGDLVASWVKRCCDASDFGTALPGHGGILDRIDSLLYAAPAALMLGVVLERLTP